MSYDTWNGSWGVAWGVAWGTGAVSPSPAPAPAPVVHHDSGPGGQFPVIRKRKESPPPQEPDWDLLEEKRRAARRQHLREIFFPQKVEAADPLPEERPVEFSAPASAPVPKAYPIKELMLILALMD